MRLFPNQRRLVIRLLTRDPWINIPQYPSHIETIYTIQTYSHIFIKSITEGAEIDPPQIECTKRGDSPPSQSDGNEIQKDLPRRYVYGGQ